MSLALSFFLAASAQDHAGAENAVGAMYASGRGLEQNLKLAVSWVPSRC